MTDWPIVENIDPFVISPAVPQSIGGMLDATAHSISPLAWSVANKAFYVPFSVSSPVVIAKMFVLNGGTVSGNIDVGIYDRGGVRLVSSGSTPQSGASAAQEFNVTDTILNPGMYYLACAMDNTTGTLEVWSISATIARTMGIAEQTSAFALPSTATFASLTGSPRIPCVGATQRTVV